MIRKSRVLAVSAFTMLLVGCGPNLNGTFTGTHNSSSPSFGYQVYTTSMTLTQDGDKVSGQIMSQPQGQAQQTGGQYPYGNTGYTSNQPLNGQIQGKVDGDIIRDVRLTIYRNTGYSTCPETYLGSFTIADGSRIQGMLMQSPSTTSSTGGEGGTYDQCAQQQYGVGSSSFDVRK